MANRSCCNGCEREIGCDRCRVGQICGNMKPSCVRENEMLAYEIKINEFQATLTNLQEKIGYMREQLADIKKHGDTKNA